MQVALIGLETHFSGFRYGICPLTRGSASELDSCSEQWNHKKLQKVRSDTASISAVAFKDGYFYYC